MYNRYVRNDAGVYQRIPAQESPRDQPSRREPPRDPGPRQEPQSGSHPPPPPQDRRPSLSSTSHQSEQKNPLAGILSKLRLDGIDTGDLLLLAILFLLFRDGEDEELLIALGLLLIL